MSETTRLVRYVGLFDEVVLDGGGVAITAPRGQAVEVAAALAKRLLEQPSNWEPAEWPATADDEPAPERATRR